jgi:hypothetical protein
MSLDINLQRLIDSPYFFLKKKHMKHGNPIFPERLQIIRAVEPPERQFHNITPDVCLLHIEVQLLPFDLIPLFFLAGRILQPALMPFVKPFNFLSLCLSQPLQPISIHSYMVDFRISHLIPEIFLCTFNL